MRRRNRGGVGGRGLGVDLYGMIPGWDLKLGTQTFHRTNILVQGYSEVKAEITFLRLGLCSPEPSARDQVG